MGLSRGIDRLDSLPEIKEAQGCDDADEGSPLALGAPRTYNTDPSQHDQTRNAFSPGVRTPKAGYGHIPRVSPLQIWYV